MFLPPSQPVFTPSQILNKNAMTKTPSDFI
jgi:hypothetical protein